MGLEKSVPAFPVLDNSKLCPSLTLAALMIRCPGGDLGTKPFQRDSGGAQHEQGRGTLRGQPIGSQPACAGGGAQAGRVPVRPQQAAPGTDRREEEFTLALET